MKNLVKHLIPNVGTFVIVGLLFLAQSVGALPSAAPAEPLAPSQTVISYQGTLTDKSGNPLNQAVTMEFSLYDAVTGGNRLWGPETQSVQVSNGLFHVLLGSVTPIDPDPLSGDLYLNIKVNGEALSPREVLSSVVYAVEASTLSAGANTRGDLTIMGNTRLQSPSDGIYGLSLHRTDEDGRMHEWKLWHMNQNYGKNELELWEYKTDSNGQSCGGDPDDGAICTRRLTITEGGNFALDRDLDARRLKTSAGAEIGLQDGGGGRLIIANNPGDNKVYIEAVSTDSSGSASQLLLTGRWGQNVPSLALKADEIDMTGRLDMNGHTVTNCGALTEANLQTEEELAAERIERFEEGDVLCWGDDRLEKCAQAGDPLVQAVADVDGRPIVIGAELVKVIGPVKKGDFLVASDVPGYTMAARSPAFGTVIAQALEDFDGEQGIIKAMIRKI